MTRDPNLRRAENPSGKSREGDLRLRLTERLRAAGLRATEPRLRVLEVLSLPPGHRSVEEVGAALAARGLPLTRGSIYQVMESLVRAGLVMIADAGPGRTLYEIATAWHHHFVCRRCGKVIDVPCAVGDKPCLEPSGLPGTVDEAQIIWRGVCRDCESELQRNNGDLD